MHLGWPPRTDKSARKSKWIAFFLSLITSVDVLLKNLTCSSSSAHWAADQAAAVREWLPGLTLKVSTDCQDRQEGRKKERKTLNHWWHCLKPTRLLKVTKLHKWGKQKVSCWILHLHDFYPHIQKDLLCFCSLLFVQKGKHCWLSALKNIILRSGDILACFIKHDLLSPKHRNTT